MYHGSDIVLGTGYIKVKLVLSTSDKYENKEVPCRGSGLPMEVDHRVAGGTARGRFKASQSEMEAGS